MKLLEMNLTAQGLNSYTQKHIDWKEDKLATQFVISISFKSSVSRP